MKKYPPEQKSQYSSRDLLLEEAISKPDLSSIESNDPSLLGGFKIVYNKEVPLDLKVETKEGLKDMASYELIRFKLLSDSINKEDIPQKIKLELSWESDLLFHYTNIVDEKTFLNIKKNQNLNIDFPQYINLIRKMCENCINNPDHFICTFTIKNDGISKLHFVKETEFKNIDLITLEFNNSSDEVIKEHILYRFTYLKTLLDYKKKALKVTGDVIFGCNPDIINPILESNDISPKELIPISRTIASSEVKLSIVRGRPISLL